MQDQKISSSKQQTQNTQIVLSEDQDRAVNKILDWWNNDTSQQRLLTMGGYAGTGKTTVLSFVRKELGEDIAVGFVSFTGKAVSVMHRKLRESNTLIGADQVSTMHSFMYKPVLNEKKEIIDWAFKPMRDPLRPLGFGEKPWDYAPYVDLFIMDEASMTPEDVYNDLLSYGKPILAVGDHGQLPPVKGNFSLMQEPELRLEKIHRQAEDNPILLWAHMAREGRDIPYEDLGKARKMRTRDFSGSDVEEEIVAKPGPDRMVIVGTNRERLSVNKAVLQHIRGVSKIEPKPKVGDRVICLKNNHRMGLYNGMLATVVKEKQCIEHPEHNWHFIIEPDEGGSMPVTMTKHTFLNTYNKIPDNVPFHKVKERFDFAYAITCHKSQGSEAEKVVIIGRGFGEPDVRRRWMYTAITRAREEVYLVG